MYLEDAHIGLRLFLNAFGLILGFNYLNFSSLNVAGSGTGAIIYVDSGLYSARGIFSVLFSANLSIL
jgi:hypothetical protein